MDSAWWTAAYLLLVVLLAGGFAYWWSRRVGQRAPVLRPGSKITVYNDHLERELAMVLVSIYYENGTIRAEMQDAKSYKAAHGLPQGFLS